MCCNLYVIDYLSHKFLYKLREFLLIPSKINTYTGFLNVFLFFLCLNTDKHLKEDGNVQNNKRSFLLLPHICLGLSFVPFIFILSLSPLLFITIFYCVYIPITCFLLSAPCICFSDCKTSYLWHAAKKPS